MANRTPRRKRSKTEPTSLLPMCLTIGFFLGLGLGPLMDAVLVVIVLGMVAGAAVGYLIDRRNGVRYTRRRRTSR